MQYPRNSVFFRLETGFQQVFNIHFLPVENVENYVENSKFSTFFQGDC